MHFCAGLPIILVGCKKDLRRDPRVIDELRKTSQRPVTPEEVCVSYTLASFSYVTTFSHLLPQSIVLFYLSLLSVRPIANYLWFNREWQWPKRLVPSTTSNVLLNQVKAYVRSSNTPLGQLFSVEEREREGATIALFCKFWPPEPECNMLQRGMGGNVKQFNDGEEGAEARRKTVK